MADYTTTPYNLEWGSSIFAKVYATNVKGDSVESIEGNGAIIIRVPDVPVNLANVPSITSGSTVGLTWEDGANNGGSEVIDYMIAIAYDDVAVGHDGNTFKSFKLSFTLTPTSESLHENSFWIEYLNTIVSRIGHDDVSLVVNSNPSVSSI